MGKSIRQRFIRIHDVYKEYNNLKSTVTAMQKYIDQAEKNNPSDKQDRTLIDNMKRRLTVLEVKLDKLPEL